MSNARSLLARTVLFLSLSLGVLAGGAPTALACGSYSDVPAGIRAQIEQAIQRHFVVRFDSPPVTIDAIELGLDDATVWVRLSDGSLTTVEVISTELGWRVAGDE